MKEGKKPKRRYIQKEVESKKKRMEDGNKRERVTKMTYTHMNACMKAAKEIGDKSNNLIFSSFCKREI